MSSSKQLKIQDMRKTPLNLIQHEFYSFFPNAQKGVIKQPHAQKYYELREIPTQDGFRQQLVEVPYPITADYVKSFADSADYHNDIATAMALPPRGANLGDMTSLQELCNLDLSAVQALKEKLSVVEKEKLAQAQKQPAVANNTENTTKGSEVNG